VKLFDQETLAS